MICDSVTDSLAGDFNRDGKLDLAIACHTRHGDHRIESRVFYNDGDRFQNHKLTKLSTNGTHLMWAADIGHIYDRKNQQTDESSLFAWNQPARDGRITFKAEIPQEMKLGFQVRSAERKGTLGSQKWRPVDTNQFSLRPQDRCLQYRALFQSDNGDRYPVLDRVEVSLRR